MRCAVGLAAGNIRASNAMCRRCAGAKRRGGCRSFTQEVRALLSFMAAKGVRFPCMAIFPPGRSARLRGLRRSGWRRGVDRWRAGIDGGSAIVA